MLNLKVKEIRRKKKVIAKEGKTEKTRTIYLENIYDELNKYINSLEGTEWIFPRRKGDNLSPGSRLIGSLIRQKEW